MIDFKCVLQHFGLMDNINIEDEKTIRMSCPIHCGDNPTGFSWDKEFRRWRCWTRGCHDSYKNTLSGFIDGMIEQIGIGATRKDIINEILSNNKNAIVKQHNNREIKKDIALTEYTDLKISERQISIQAMKWWGISKKVIDKYLVGIYPNITAGRILFPIFETSGRIVGATGRKIYYSKDSEFPKWKHYHIKTNNILYNIHAFKPKKNSIILTEGPSDVLKLETANIHNGLALFGDNIGEAQIKILNNLGVEKIILALDNDKAGRKATKKIGETLANHGYKVEVMCIDKYNDIGETPLFLLKRNVFEIKELCEWKKSL